MKIRMSLLVPVLTGLAIWASSVAAQSKTEGTSSKIIALENKWNAAYNRGDIATMESLLAEDFIITVEDGTRRESSGGERSTPCERASAQCGRLTDDRQT